MKTVKFTVIITLLSVTMLSNVVAGDSSQVPGAVETNGSGLRVPTLKKLAIAASAIAILKSRNPDEVKDKLSRLPEKDIKISVVKKSILIMKEEEAVRGMINDKINKMVKENSNLLNLSELNIETVPYGVSNKIEAVMILDLSKNLLSSLPDIIGGLKMLEILNLEYNKISRISDAVGGLKMLSSLDLSHNLLSSVSASIGGLKMLISLDLSHNLISSLPASIGGLKMLRSLDLSYNNISYISDAIGNLEMVLDINLNHNKLTFLPESIEKCKNLRILYLQGNDFSPEERKRIIGWLPNVRYITFD